MNEPEVIDGMLGEGVLKGQPRTIAVVGLSDNPGKPSHYVSAYMQKHGYRILPVNPSVESVLGEKCYASLAELPVKPDVVNVFRVPAMIPAIVDEMLMLGLKDLWVQAGIVNTEAAERAEAGGIRVVMDRCIMIEHRRREGA
ncbi:MAG TPA: CoA-binding protein [Acidobacteriaceae bacterium]|nr:CoA-binding protein [Acidobacteriaceae bacterium]